MDGGVQHEHEHEHEHEHGARPGADPHGGGAGSLGQVAALVALVDAWQPQTGGDGLAAALVAVDRLTAKLTRSIGAFDADSGWELDGATSIVAWLRDRSGATVGDAVRAVRTARRLRRWPITAEAWEAGTLSGGQVRAICANVTERAVDLFGEHEREVVPLLAQLSTGDTAKVMQGWAARAEAVLEGRGQGRPPRRSQLRCSKVLDGGRRLDGDFGVEAGEVIATALRLAESSDVAGEPARTPAERRADALTDLCRSFLDHRDTGDGGAVGRRHRPHVNVVCDVRALGPAGGDAARELSRAAARGRPGEVLTAPGARLVDGTPLDAATTARLLCDAGVHRVVTDGRSAILDYGTTTRTIPPPLFNALVVRDGGCRWPGCDRPPHWTEGHHVVPWTAGGPTNPTNLVLLCARHHHLAHGQAGHRSGWSLEMRPDASLVVTTPEGRRLRSRPAPGPSS